MRLPGRKCSERGPKPQEPQLFRVWKRVCKGGLRRGGFREVGGKPREDNAIGSNKTVSSNSVDGPYLQSISKLFLEKFLKFCLVQALTVSITLCIREESINDTDDASQKTVSHLV